MFHLRGRVRSCLICLTAAHLLGDKSQASPLLYCLSLPSLCEVCSVHTTVCILHTMQGAVCSVQGAGCRVQSVVGSVLCAMFSSQCIVCSAQCTLNTCTRRNPFCPFSFFHSY